VWTADGEQDEDDVEMESQEASKAPANHTEFKLWKDRAQYKPLQNRRDAAKKGKKGIGMPPGQSDNLGQAGHRQPAFFETEFRGEERSRYHTPNLVRDYGDRPSRADTADTFFNGKILPVASNAYITRAPKPQQARQPSLLMAQAMYRTL
jgi:hypothetical protein